ncbi:MAG: OmpA family protein [Bacteroidetes bacterium]|nr:OmpA family protein [Bacteroidota bacterium]
MGACQMGMAQFSRADFAEELMERWKYADAYPIWSELAADTTFSDSAHWEFIRQASISAQKADFIPEADQWNAQLLQSGFDFETDWIRQFEMVCLENRYDDLQTLIAEGKLRFPESTSILKWQNGINELIALVHDSTSFEVTKLRPQSEAEEFCAVPYDSTLVFMSTGLNAGFVPQHDGWTGQYYTKLTQIKDLKVPFKEYTWFEQVRNQDLFQAFDPTRVHDGPIAFNAEENYAVITRNHNDASLDTTGRVVRSRLKLEFWLLSKDEEEKDVWEQRPDSLFPWNDRHFSAAHGTFDLNEDLIFASDRPGGYGGMDLYHSKWVDGRWDEPVNLGPVVNTAGDEVFPFVSKTGAIFFSSNGQLGAGGLDIFIYRAGAAKLERLGYPINSNGDDFAFVFDEMEGKGWLSSNREAQKDAIYKVKGNPTAGKLTVHVQSCDGSPLSDTEVKVINVDLGSEVYERTDNEGNAHFIAQRNQSYEITTQELEGMNTPPVIEFLMLDKDSVSTTLDMNFEIELNRLTIVDLDGNPLPNALLSFENDKKQRLNRVTDEFGIFEWGEEISKDYSAVHVSLINYWDGYQGFEQPPAGCPMSIQKTIALRPKTEESEVIRLDVINYDNDSDKLLEEGKLELDKLISIMNDPQWMSYRIEFRSHTSCLNTVAYNLGLSQRRSQSCVDYIVSKGIDPSRIIAKGYGESQLLNECADFVTCGCEDENKQLDPNCRECTEIQHRANRRTELRLLPDE